MECRYLVLATTKTTGQVPLKIVRSQGGLTTILLKKVMEKWQKRAGCISRIKSFRFFIELTPPKPPDTESYCRGNGSRECLLQRRILFA